MSGLADKALEMTKSWIAMRPDTAERANAVVEEAARLLAGSGLKPEVMENKGSKMLYCYVGSGKRTLVLNGHVDVVMGENEQYTPVIDGDKLYGRGSYDMLGGSAAITCFAASLASKPPKASVLLMLSSTEETDGSICTGYMLEKGLIGDFAICAEPTNLAVSVMSKGVLRLGITVSGVAAHSSRPWQGENALLKAYEIYKAIEQLPFAGQKNAYFEGASVNLSKVSGGIVMNQVPARADMVVDIRYVPGSSVEDIISQISALDAGAVVKILGSLDAVAISDDDPYLARLGEAVAKNFGKYNKIAQHGAADTAFFQRHGIPSVEFGLCGAGHHGKSECLWIPSLEIFCNTLHDTVRLFEA